jgi:ligand-binding sensor domain-containing protein
MKSCLREVAVLAIAIDPADTNTLYAIGNDAAWVVGMFKNHKNEIRYESKFRDYAFKSTNGGKKWSSINIGFEKYNLELESLAVDPIEPNTLYAGTRSGIYKSVDWGANWPEHKCKLGELNINTIVIDPRNNNTIYVGTMVGVFKSTDGGTNWTYFSKGLNKIDVLALAIEPDNTATVYAGTINGVYKSTDGGTNWYEINNGLNKNKIQELAIDPNNKNILYAGAVDGIYKSTDGGNKWIISK